jgi:hypothetical protein
MRRLAIVAGLLVALPAAARAGELEPQGTARVHDRSWMSVGVFAPLVWAPADRVELSVHPLLWVSYPNAKVRVEHLRRGSLHLAGEYGQVFPSPALRLAPPLGLAGYLTPSCLVTKDDPTRAPGSCDRPGWHLVPSVGLIFTWGDRHPLTAKLDVAAGIVLAGQRGAPLDTWAPLDLELAPVFNVFRVHLGVRYDRLLHRIWRLVGELHLWAVGPGPAPQRSPLVVSTYLGTELALGRYTRLSVGFHWYNSDQRRTQVVTDADGYGKRVKVRSNELRPGLDFIWAWEVRKRRR